MFDCLEFEVRLFSEARTFPLNIKISESILAYQFIKRSPRDGDYVFPNL